VNEILFSNHTFETGSINLCQQHYPVNSLYVKIDGMHDEMNISELSYSDLSGRGGQWSTEEEKLLYDGTKAGKSTSELAALHNRTQLAISSRQARLGLREDRHSDLIDPLPEFSPYASNSTGARPKTRKKRTKPNTNKEQLDLGKIEKLLSVDNFCWNETNIHQDPVEALWDAIVQDTKSLKSYTDARREQVIALSRLDPNPSSGKVVTLQLLGDEFGITRARVGQIEKRAKRKIFSASKIQQKNLGVVIQLLSTAFDLNHKSDEEIVNQYVAMLLAQRCSLEFTQGVIQVVLRMHNIRKIRTKSVLDKYKRALTIIRDESKRSYAQEHSIEITKQNADQFLTKALRNSVFHGNFARQVNNLDGFEPLRNVNRNREIYAESLQRYVQWESHGERKFIKAMENSSIITDFVEQPIRIRYGLGGDKLYVPDFLIRTSEGLVFVVEIKFRKQLADYEVLCKAKAASEYLGNLGVGYCLIDHYGVSVNDLKMIHVPEDFKTFLRARLIRNRRVEWSDLYEFFDGPPDDSAIDQIQSLALRYPDKLRYITNLERGNESENSFKLNFEFTLV
jgi:hypothetical protein